MSGATRALVLAGGTPPYVDPWHPFAATSGLLAGLASDLGFEVEVATDVAARLADLTGVDVLIAGVPSPDQPLDHAVLDAASLGLRDFLARPGGVFALHVSVTTLLGLAGWSETIGARWIPGTTMHPPRGVTDVSVVSGNHFGAAPGAFTLDDELYSFLEFDGNNETVVTHRYEDTDHPLVWAREVGPTRVVADALGHGAESFDSTEHVAIIRAGLRWLAAPFTSPLRPSIN